MYAKLHIQNKQDHRNKVTIASVQGKISIISLIECKIGLKSLKITCSVLKVIRISLGLENLPKCYAVLADINGLRHSCNLHVMLYVN